jgi:hypothetical protein
VIKRTIGRKAGWKLGATDEAREVTVKPVGDVLTVVREESGMLLPHDEQDFRLRERFVEALHDGFAIGESSAADGLPAERLIRQDRHQLSLRCFAKTLFEARSSLHRIEPKRVGQYELVDRDSRLRSPRGDEPECFVAKDCVL